MESQKLQTAYRPHAESDVGNLALANPNNTVTRELKLRNNLETQFAEIVNGSMRTEFELKFNGHDLIGEDGSSMDEVTSDSLTTAEKMANAHPFFQFEKRRRQYEREEYEELVEMAKGNGPNAMIVVSDFPPELYSSSKDVGGYNVRRKQTMMRVMIRKPDGNIQMYSQSLDRSDREGLEAIYNRFGQKPEAGELLGQRIRAEVPLAEQENLTDELMNVYDQSLASRLGGEWRAGRQPVDSRNTYDFVCRQTDLIDHCIDMNKQGLLNDQYMYNIAATMQERFDKKISSAINTFTRQDIAGITYEIMRAGMRAEEMGMTFSGCGVTMNSRSKISGVNNSLEVAGYGNKATDNCEFTSKECPQCGAKNVNTRVSRVGNQRHISGSCGCHKVVAADD